MTRRRLVLFVGGLILAGLLGGALWLSWAWGSRSIPERYEDITIGMSIEDAEPALSLPRAPTPPQWDSRTGPLILDQESAPNVAFLDSEGRWYTRSGYWVILYHDTATKAVISKELRRERTLTEEVYLRVVGPPMTFGGY